MGDAIIGVSLVGFIAFLQWLKHDRRNMVHRERMAAIEKGIELPPLIQEVQRSTWNVQRVLLLLGCSWVAVGIGTIGLLSTLLVFPPSEVTKDIPQGMQVAGLIPLGIGIAHLITYWVGERRERASRG